MAITSHDIAREAGVSQSTVSRALRGDPRVAMQTTQKVQDVAKRLKYAPNAAARSLIMGRSSTIAVFVSDIRNPFYPQLVDDLYDEFSLAGYRTVLFNERNETRGDDLLSRLHRGAIDGAVFVSATLNTKLPELLVAQDVPVAVLNREVEGVDVDVVVSDNVSGASLAAETLTALGHRRIGMIAGPDNTSTGRDRQAGFCAGLRPAGLGIDESLLRRCDYTYQGGYQWATELLRLPEPPTAIFCGNDVIAFGALDAARRLGVSVPRELSIIGYDDIEMAAWEAFGLTTVRQPLGDMAKSAARMLITRIEDQGRTPQRQVFPAGLVQRATTGPVPA